MELKWNLEAEKEFRNLENKVQEKIKTEIEKLPEKGLEWDKVGPVLKPKIDLKVFRIKINPEDNENLKHRIIFDVENQKYIIYKVGNRTKFYSRENLEEVTDRK